MVLGIQAACGRRLVLLFLIAELFGITQAEVVVTNEEVIPPAQKEITPENHIPAEGIAYDTLGGIVRYTRFDKKPMPDDTEKAIIAGGDVKCEVCEVILTHLLLDARSGITEDMLLDLFEADYVDEAFLDNKSTTDMERYIEQHKKGCNRLFKDAFLGRGWDIEPCDAPGQTKDTPKWEKAEWFCAKRIGSVPNLTQMNTYSVRMEAIHHACESTIGKYGDELAEYLTDHSNKLLKDHSATDLAEVGTRSVKKMASQACQKIAKCSVRKPSESVERRSEEVRKKAKEEHEVVMKMHKEQQQMNEFNKKLEEQNKARSQGGRSWFEL